MTDPAFSIRSLTTTDLSAVLEVYRSCEDFLALGPVATASADMVRQDMKLSADIRGEFCGIFDADGKMIGVVDFVPAGLEGNPEHAFIELLMIAHEYRGQGLGTAVVAYIEAEIRRHSQVTAILSGVQVNNPAAIRFWQKCGFTIESEPEDLPDGTTAYRLRKTLA
jgi:ribosomal protein S18 acetylase RimI-like enzyme